ncbi:MAG: hypothetical protein KGJ57_05940 [Sphingomonadales bacterium]|nr:hypothetical protein [Sphingomonadales bacterium]MDE2168959.1 hypothetical protein [Sphingomonadales bacterium]
MVLRARQANIPPLLPAPIIAGANTMAPPPGNTALCARKPKDRRSHRSALRGASGDFVIVPESALHPASAQIATSGRPPVPVTPNPAVITIHDVPLPAFPARQPPVTPRPPASEPKLTTPKPDSTGEESAIPLPQRDEPLVRPDRPFPDTIEPLPRRRALAPANRSLLGAVNIWLRWTGQALLRGFMVKTSRRRPDTATTMREKVELTQLRAENRRLRQQLERIGEQRAANAPAHRKETAVRARSDMPPEP